MGRISRLRSDSLFEAGAAPWDGPQSPPLRPGDRSPEPIFTAVGRALTNWEGVEAYCAILYAALLSDEPGKEDLVHEFGNTHKVAARVKKIREQSKHFFSEARCLTDTKLQQLSDDITHGLQAYEGWSMRRNELAHGDVTKSEHPDYGNDSLDIVKSYSLCPSHGNRRRWSFSLDPEYHYNAAEIEGFARAFELLGERLNNVADEIRKLSDSD